MSTFPSFPDAYASHSALAPSPLRAPLPPARFARSQPFRSLPPPPVPARSLSDTSTKMTELSSCRASDMDAYGAAPLAERYIPILPRTSSHAHYNKRCETCGASHDGSFGAGRFCSSRCARTVGGLAHRKKRLMERENKQRHAQQKRLSNKRLRAAVVSYKSDSVFPMRVASPIPLGVPRMAPTAEVARGVSAPSALAPPPPPHMGELATTQVDSSRASFRSPKSVMTITALLNPSE
eukprot:TRINITY_DN73174_c0_g1_i1.p1 TRINITY_DN73174_c0_g1~~TRINITY_DN73174_c0_g1_i1.p1  ORF type:complete len:237 (-),score=55.12 TRINITY_DN73174_c0_g1_i1:157-867(-)